MSRDPAAVSGASQVVSFITNLKYPKFLLRNLSDFQSTRLGLGMVEPIIPGLGQIREFLHRN